MIILQGVNNEAITELCPDKDNGCWNCDNCGGSVTN